MGLPSIIVHSAPPAGERRTGNGAECKCMNVAHAIRIGTIVIQYPNTFQAILVLFFLALGVYLGAESDANMGHSALIMPLLGALGGALVGLLVSGTILMITNYWGRRGRDD